MVTTLNGVRGDAADMGGCPQGKVNCVSAGSSALGGQVVPNEAPIPELMGMVFLDFLRLITGDFTPGAEPDGVDVASSAGMDGGGGGGGGGCRSNSGIFSGSLSG